MQITDPIADLLTRIRNASTAKHPSVAVSYTHLDVYKRQGREPEVPDALKKYRPLTGAALGNHPGRLLFVI